MCMYSAAKYLDLAQTGDRLTIVKADSPHTGGRWFQSSTCNKLVCVANQTPLLIRATENKAIKALRIPYDGLVVFREIRNGSLDGDFVEFDYVGKKKLVKVGDLPIGSQLEVVSQSFVDTLHKAGDINEELNNVPEKDPTLVQVVTSMMLAVVMIILVS